MRLGCLGNRRVDHRGAADDLGERLRGEIRSAVLNGDGDGDQPRRVQPRQLPDLVLGQRGAHHPDRQRAGPVTLDHPVGDRLRKRVRGGDRRLMGGDLWCGGRARGHRGVRPCQRAKCSA